jgi:Na+:H+ antiporter, NhaA family
VKHPSIRSRRPVTLSFARRSLERFLRLEAASTLLLLGAAVVALWWANSSLSSIYASVWQTPVTLSMGPWTWVHPVRFFINEGLMTVFFLVIGLEIRGELYDGALSERRVAILPVLAACGGMLFPALLFIAINSGAAERRGWAIPTATDIAFAVGVLTLLGKRVPRTLRVVLLALAIVDDIGAVLVIAVYYSDGFVASGFAISIVAVLVVLGLQRCGLQRPAWYVLPGVLLWCGLDQAGVHPTLAGVILGLLAPVRHKQPAGASPAESLKNALHPWVAFAIMPLFALANAGVELQGITAAPVGFLRVGAGVVLGLVVGKPVGIVLTTALGVRFGVCTLPGGIRWPHIVLLGCLGGIGFTMSIFLADLAFVQGELLSVAKTAVLLGSVVAAGIGVGGWWAFARLTEN